MTQHENTTPNHSGDDRPDVVVTRSGSGPAIAIVAVVALVALVIALFFFVGGDSGGEEGDGPLIDVPVEMDGGDGGGEGGAESGS